MNKKILLFLMVGILGISNGYAAKKAPPKPPPPPSKSEYQQTDSICDDFEECIQVYPSIKFNEQYLVIKQLAPAFTDLVSVLKKTEPAFSIEAKECGQINSWYSPANKTLTICYDYLADGDAFIENAYANHPPDVQANLQTGIFIQLLMHEFGHAAIDIKQIPVLGNEEDAVDRIATITMLGFDKTNPNIAKLAMIGSIAYWNHKADDSRKNMTRNRFANEHPLDDQRVFNMVCLAYGSNPNQYLDVARNVGLPEARAARCEGEYKKAVSAISEFLE